MPETKAREELLDLLDKKVFEPVLNASPERYSKASDKELLKNVQDTMRTTYRRYHEKYISADEVADNFKNDLSSGVSQHIQAEVKQLGLPTFDDVKDEMFRLEDRLGAGH